MRTFILFLLALPIFGQGLFRASHPCCDLYVDQTSGNDSNSGKTPATAWKTVAKVNAATLTPYQQIGFKRGETWRETLTPGQSGTAGSPITFAAYGNGAQPKVTGANTFNTTGAWSQVTSEGTNPVYPGTGTDDGYWDSVFNNSSDAEGPIGGGYHQTYLTYFSRFQTITIPQGATISSAVITMRGNGNEGGTGLSATIRAVTEDNATAPTSAQDGAGRSLTTASVVWAMPDAWSTGAYATDDISSVIQEIVNRPGWASGNAMVIYFTSTGSQYTAHNARTYEGGVPYNSMTIGYGVPVANLWKTSVANLPRVVFLDGTPGTEVASQGALVSQGQWWYDSTNHVVEIYSASNPATYYADVQIPIRQYAASLSSRSYLELRGLALCCTYGAVVNGDGYGRGSYNVTLSQVAISYGSQYSIKNSGGSGWIISQSDISNTQVVPSATTYGLIFSDGVVGGVISTSTIHDNHGEFAVFITASSGISVTGNTIYSNDGDAVRYDSMTGGTNNFLYNVVHDNGATPPDSTVGNGLYVSGFTAGAMNIYNNTFVTNGNATSNGENIHIVSGAGETNVKNNLSYLTSSSATHWCIDVFKSTATTIDYNLYFKTTGAVNALYWVDPDNTPNTYLASPAGLADWTSHTGGDTHGIAGSDPLLNADYTLAVGSPAIGVGVVIAGVTPASNVNIGAK